MRPSWQKLLDFNGNGSVHLREGDFHGLTGLATLDLSNIDISRIRYDDRYSGRIKGGLFDELSSLEMLNLSNNNLYPRIDDDAFDGLGNLTEIDLRGFSRNPAGTNSNADLDCWSNEGKARRRAQYPWDARLGSPLAFEPLSNQSDLQIEGGLMLAVGGLGLAVNLAAAYVLQAGSKHSLNVDGTFRHLLANLIGSSGVVASGVVVLLTGWLPIDPILSVGIALLIVVGSWRLVLRSVNALLKVPDHIDLYALCAEIEDVPGVALIHDVHLFTITRNFEFLTAHILIDPSYKGGDNGLQESMRRIASGKYGVHHVTLQLCRTAGECPENHFAGDPKAVARPSL